MTATTTVARERRRLTPNNTAWKAYAMVRVDHGRAAMKTTCSVLSSTSQTSISWIGTVQAWLLISVGVLSGPLFDLGYFCSMLIVGNFLVVLGIMMLSLLTIYWQVSLSQNVCMGLGAGLLYIPSLALVGVWFDKKRALALGIVMSGIAVGGIIYISE
jgi:MFS family permease